MIKAAHISSLLLLMTSSGVGHFHGENFTLVSNGVDAMLQSPIIEPELKASSVTCKPIYGFLPCTTMIWGQLFLIVVYAGLLSLAEQYVSSGSNLFFQMTGTGSLGASLCHFLGSIPEVVMVLVSGLSSSTETAETQAAIGMGLLAGSAVMLLTLTWGSCVAFGSYNLPDSSNSSSLENHRPSCLTGYGVSTDVKTSHTARFMILSMVPLLILQLENFLTSSPRKRVVILVSLLVTLAFLFLYCFYQLFQPWIQNRRLEYLMHKYIQSNLLQSLLTADGDPDISRITKLFHEIDKNNDASISAAELRAFLLGIKLKETGLNNVGLIERVMKTLDTSGDGQINEMEFVGGISRWLYEANHQNKDQSGNPPHSSSRASEEQQRPIAGTENQGSQLVQKTWFNYIKAAFLLISGTAMLCFLAYPIIEAIQEFSSAANIHSAIVSYIVVPVAMNHREALGLIKSTRKKTEKGISLAFSEIYNAVFMNNLMGLATFLALVYIRNLSWNVSAEVLVFLIIFIVMGLLTSFFTKFPFWTSIVAYAMYPISLVLLYVLTEVLGWS